VPSRSIVVSALRSAGCVYAEEEAQLLVGAAQTPAELAVMVERRIRGEPIEHIVGWAEFCGLRIVVEPGVFIPRRRTEFLAREAASLAGSRAVVVDLCCGSGAVSAALIAAMDEVDLCAVDIDPRAVQCARRNIGTAGQVYEGDLYDPLPTSLHGRVDVLVANAPYVPTGEIVLLPVEARRYEQRMALDGGADGLDVLRRVISGAPPWLTPDGQLLVETSDRQAPAVRSAIAHSGLIPRVARSEDLNATIVVGARRQSVGSAGQPVRL
jgi:release factor glutamine methyltransferase